MYISITFIYKGDKIVVKISSDWIFEFYSVAETTQQNGIYSLADVV